MEAHSPEIRELPPGDRPKDWIADAVAGAEVDAKSEQTQTRTLKLRRLPILKPLRHRHWSRSAIGSSSRRARNTSICSKPRRTSWHTPCRTARSKKCTYERCGCS